jgi:hypothetical protein
MKHDGSIHLFSGTKLPSKLRRAAQSVGPESLGFNHTQIGINGYVPFRNPSGYNYATRQMV